MSLHTARHVSMRFTYAMRMTDHVGPVPRARLMHLFGFALLATRAYGPSARRRAIVAGFDSGPRVLHAHLFGVPP